MLDFDERSAERDISIVAQHVTLRQASWLCCLARGSKGANGQLHLVLRDSAFDLAGRGAALIRLLSPAQPSGRGRAVLITGADSVIRPEIPIVGWSKPGADSVTAVDARGLSVEGLAVGDFQFVGPMPPAGTTPPERSPRRRRPRRSTFARWPSPATRTSRPDSSPPAWAADFSRLDADGRPAPNAPPRWIEEPA